MTPEAIIRRKMNLKGQAVKLIRGEMRELVHLKNLLGLEKLLQSKINPEFDRSLSARLDAVLFLIESFETGAGAKALYGDSLQIPAAPSLAGREMEDANRLDKALQKTPYP
jgi:hypothetical protein